MLYGMRIHFWCLPSSINRTEPFSILSQKFHIMGFDRIKNPSVERANTRRRVFVYTKVSIIAAWSAKNGVGLLSLTVLICYCGGLTWCSRRICKFFSACVSFLLLRFVLFLIGLLKYNPNRCIEISFWIRRVWKSNLIANQNQGKIKMVIINHNNNLYSG